MRRQSLQSIREFDDLLNRFQVAFKKNDAARRRGFQERSQLFGYRGSRKANHEELADLFA
jgi:hypothetical protein